jgi:hypothetical protein
VSAGSGRCPGSARGSPPDGKLANVTDRDDEWIEVFIAPVGSNESTQRLTVVGPAVRGFDVEREVAPSDVRIDLFCLRGAPPTAWLRVSIRRGAHPLERGPIIAALPLDELHPPGGGSTLRRQDELHDADVRGLLRSGRVRLAVAEVGRPVAWVPERLRFEVWKLELRPHLARPEEAPDLDASHVGYAYVASQWSGADEPVVLFERRHR